MRERDVRLSAAQRWGALAVLVSVFLFAGGPIWSNPFDVDMGAWLSYAPIPLVVLALLAYSRKLGWMAWLLNTIEVTLLKFGITYGIATVLWAAHGPPPRHVETETPAQPAMVMPATIEGSDDEPTAWADERRADIDVAVGDSAGQPVAGALVWVSFGLDEMVFAAPRRAVELELGDGWRQTSEVAHPHQPIMIRSTDGRLHSVVLRERGEVARTLPLLASGAAHRLVYRGAEGVVTLSCALHSDEGSVRLLFLHHVHYGRTDSGGHVTLAGVPALPLTVSAWQAVSGGGSVDVRMSEHASITLR